ncbi:MAG: hypothetical protein DHS20C05_21570 [Hyphococcus sp.]|nr:MAG: hypothetical protein DHS20C05_21570 [Marinicaulis sp.]
MSHQSVPSKVNSARAPKPKPLRVGVAGLGVIGEGAALRLLQADSFVLDAALVRSADKKRAPAFSETVIHTDTEQFLQTDPDIVIDALSTGEAGLALIRGALARGVNIVTANKQAIAGNLAPLHALAKSHNAILNYEASVGGGAPMIKTVRAARHVGEIRSMSAIVNGTVNFILSAVKAGGSFGDAVKAAQDAGFAEPDPSADLSGEDARAKIAILSYEAFGEEIDLDAIEIEALDEAKALKFSKQGGTWKQLATISRTSDRALSGRLQFVRVDDNPFLSGIMGEGNALSIHLASGEVFTCAGKGAGRAPTVDSLFSDLHDITS